MTPERRRVLTLSGVLREHRHIPGANVCACGAWEGYSFEWHDHVAETVLAAGYTPPTDSRS